MATELGLALELSSAEKLDTRMELGLAQGRENLASELGSGMELGLARELGSAIELGSGVELGLACERHGCGEVRPCGIGVGVGNYPGFSILYGPRLFQSHWVDRWSGRRVPPANLGLARMPG